MDERVTKGVPKKRRRYGAIRIGLRFFGALAMFVRDMVGDDIAVMTKNARLYVGLGFVAVGVLSFASGRYCDGNESMYYACTRPSTFYYYPWWAILLVVVGSFSVVLWFLRNK